MAGYNWTAGKSNNAVKAENVGMRTASQLAKVIKKGVNAGEIEQVLEASSWHHTSGRFNKTYYYWEPLIELLAEKPDATDEEARTHLLASADNLRASATDNREITLAKNAQEIANADSFATHLQEERARLERLIELAKQRKAADKEAEKVRVNLSYPVFSHSRRYGYKFVEQVELKAIEAKVEGDWITFEHEGRRTRKKLSSESLHVEFL